MGFLQKVIDVYLERNIPFAVFKYPNEVPKIIAQYNTDFLIEDIDFSKEGFLIHPFIKNEETAKTPKTPIAFIKPDVFTSNFSKINLTDIPVLKRHTLFTYSENLIDYTSYQNILQEYLSLLKRDTLQKVIASRIVEFPKIEKRSLQEKFEKLYTQNPTAFCYLFNLSGIGLWLGATPEILLHYQNNVASTVALAGTKKLNERKGWGEKEIEEQGLVGEYIENICRNLNLKVKAKSNIETITAGNIQHLKTSYKIEVDSKTANQLVKALHPTPAVAGLPKNEAIQQIIKTENYDRQYYTGFLGMIQPNKLQLYVNLRCAKITANNTLAFVGGGITKSSNIESEWKETIEKSKTIANIL